MTCDHDASRSSLRAFLESTDRHVFQSLEEGEYPLLLGNCRGCHSTIAVEVDLARGSIVKGEITTPAEVHEAMQIAPHDGKLFRQARAAIETIDEHARRVIR